MSTGGDNKRNGEPTQHVTSSLVTLRYRIRYLKRFIFRWC